MCVERAKADDMRRFLAWVFLWVWVAVLAALPSCAAGPDADPSPGPWRGRIVDIETKTPIEGAVVVAVWERVWRTPAGDNVKFYEAKEVLTDKDGNYEVPAYKPVNVVPLMSYMRGPRFIIFKPGYLSIEYYLEENVMSKTMELQTRGKAYRLSPGLIELPQLQSRQERLEILSLPTSIPDEKMPKLIESMNKEAVAFGLKPSRLGKGGR